MTEVPPPVTWLLPVRNGMPYLPMTLDSIARQTYSNHKIIAWDNGSTDGTLEVLKEWIPRKIDGLIVHGRPLRLGASLAALVEMADTELCAIIHGDDINHPWRLEQQVAFLKQHPEVGIAGGQCDFIDEEGRPIPGWSFSADDAAIRWRMRWMSHFMHPATMFRRGIVLQAGNYRDCQPHEDLDLWIRASRFAEFRNLETPVIQYRRTSTSQTGRTEDFKAIFREGARMNAGILFPNRPAEDAMALWEASYPDEEPAPVRWTDFAALRQAAVLLAQSFHKPDNYFTATEFYSMQRYHMRRRWLDQFGLGFLRRWRRSLAKSPKFAS